VDTSTKFFRRVEIFRLEFFQSLYSELLSIDCQVPRELMSRARCILRERCVAAREKYKPQKVLRSRAELEGNFVSFVTASDQDEGKVRTACARRSTAGEAQMLITRHC
jgi:hypothetical protein